jgi:hypothetical protein
MNGYVFVAPANLVLRPMRGRPYLNALICRGLVRSVDPVVNKLSPSFGSYATLAGARLAPAQSYQLDLWLDYNYGLLAFQLGDEKLGDLIVHRLDVHLMGAVAVTDWLELALDLPFTPWQAHGFDDLQAATGFVDEAPSAAGLGDVRVLARAGLLRDPEGPVLVAAIFEARGLTGDGELSRRTTGGAVAARDRRARIRRAAARGARARLPLPL